jgi:hypothetical protein
MEIPLSTIFVTIGKKVGIMFGDNLSEFLQWGKLRVRM